jgi:ubiquinone/menaquinone biosynthesis C-methylase UbiE
MYYDEIASGYNELHGEEQKKKFALIKPHLPDLPGRVLDVGCGTGLSEAICPSIIGLDPSIELLKQARYPVVCGLAEQLPFKDSSFDSIISVTAVHNFSDKAKAFEEMSRVSDRFVITVLKKAAQLAAIKELIESQFDVRECLDEEQDLIYVLDAKHL